MAYMKHFRVVWWMVAIGYICLIIFDLLFPLPQKLSFHSNMFLHLVLGKFYNYEFQNILLEYKIFALYFSALVVFVVIGFWASMMGIYFFKNWARWLYLCAAVGYIILCASLGDYSVEHTFAFVVETIVNMFEGILLFLIFFVSDIKNEFLHKSQED